MKNLTLKQLRYFDALARHAHFGRAAEICAISQPALSMQIKDLETELGSPLFERGAKEVRLTSFAETFHARVVEILRNVDELGELARAAQTGLAGRLRLGVIPTIAPYLLPRVISVVARQFPEVDLHVRETLTQRLLQELAEGALDAAIVALPISEPSLTETALFDEEFVLVRPQSDEGKPVPNAENLQKMRLLLLEEGHCFRDQALSFCSLPTAAPRDGLDSSSLSTLVQMVAAGIGVTLIPQMAVPVEARGALVDIARFAAPRPKRTIGMIWRKSNPLADRLAQLSASVKDAAQEMQVRNADA